MKIYLDFDGTVVEIEYPLIGRCNFGCFEVIKKLQDAGHEIILNTYRANVNNGTLEAALEYVNEENWMFVGLEIRDEFKLKYINATDQKLLPWPWDWKSIIDNDTMYIDDLAQNIPLKQAVTTRESIVDWSELDKQFEEHNLYKKCNNNSSISCALNDVQAR